MPTMKFLATFDGNVQYQDSAGTGTLTNDGAQTYSPGYWAGKQGVVTPEVLSLASVANAVNPAAGALLMRVQAPASFAGFFVLAGLGVTTVYPSLYLRTDVGSGQFTMIGATSVGGQLVLSTGQNMTAGANTFVYAEWSAAGLKAALEANTLVSASRAGQTWCPPAGQLKIAGNIGANSDYPAGRIDAVAIFDAPLTDAQRFYVRSMTTPWTWGMALSAPIAGYIDVLPSPGANTGAPTLTLP